MINSNLDITSIELDSVFDAHVHLRQTGQLAELVTPHLAQGGISTAYVMPNTIPPITTTKMALAYRAELQALSPNTEFLMSLYLSPQLDVEEVQRAKSAGIVGVKSYPRGVTTNSSGGVESYEIYYPVFEMMEKLGMILNLHGEVPSNPHDGTCVLNAEARFLPKLLQLHQRFPKLRIVLEHATTRNAIEAVKSCGPTVGCTITAHHLTLTVDDWAGNGLNFCKPVAKFPDDREALREVIREGHPQFFLGSDSAPHPITSKLPNHPSTCCAAGIYTSPYLLPSLASIFESALPPPTSSSEIRQILSPIPLNRLNGFVSTFGRAFYGIEKNEKGHTLARDDEKIVELKITGERDHEVVVPFWAGRKLGWKLNT
ncbi:uncharacterized protein MELLADRAFT_33928 [Melampsora larici-populina 98AG31]|uniref:dihydroorotase n=1 Tax=Melampsora larici-populina (strain 98AG31 / pathotype 3-4-7) TaxID=747676 RepID=F4RBT9_MELLP|nr:uncharacterized protein MELLADRAFT_33928 [Melampsora larici-populina 98AG31]EGG10163.1 hypothetical protein MELLADRAFT_33928 [Melampsora larici-populina 98AG31]